MHAATDMFITLRPQVSGVPDRPGQRRDVAGLAALSVFAGVGCAGPKATEDWRTEISAASGATPTTPSGRPAAARAPGLCTGGRPCPPPGRPHPAAAAVAVPAAVAGGGGGAVTVTVSGFGGGGGGVVGAGIGRHAGGGGAGPDAQRGAGWAGRPGRTVPRR